jgi:hypothetical protein
MKQRFQVLDAMRGIAAFSFRGVRLGASTLV